MLGGVLGCLSFVTSTFCTQPIPFILTYGLMAGCSLGLVYLPSVIIVNEYFRQKRGVANGIICSGSGAGLLTLGPLVNFLLGHYGLEGTILLMGGMLLNMTLFSCLYRPLDESQVDVDVSVDLGSSSDDGVSSESEGNIAIVDLGVTSNMKSLGPHGEDVGSLHAIQIPQHLEVCALEELPPESHSSFHENESNVQLHDNKSPLSAGEGLNIYDVTNTVRTKDAFQEGPYKSYWMSDHHLHNLPNASHDISKKGKHASVQHLPSWLHRETDDSHHHRNGRGHHHLYRRHHHHSRGHHHHHHYHVPRELIAGSELYLAGSISTLISLHRKRHGHVVHEAATHRSNTHVHSNADLHSNTCFDSTEDNKLSKREISNAIVPQKSFNYHEEHLIVQNEMDSNNSRTITNKFDTPVNHNSLNVKNNSNSKLILPADVLAPTPQTKEHIPNPEEPLLRISAPSSEAGDPIGDEHTQSSSLRTLLTNPSFLLFCVGACLIQVGYPVASMFLADHAYRLGYQPYHSALLMMLMGAFNIAGRLFSGFLASTKLSPLTLNNLSLMAGAVICVFCPVYTTFWSLAVLAAVYGFALGFFPPLQPLIVVEYFGLGSLGAAYGALTSAKGVTAVLGPPLAGWISDATGDHSMAFVFAGGVYVASALVHWTMPLAARSRGRRDGMKLMG